MERGKAGGAECICGTLTWQRFRRNKRQYGVYVTTFNLKTKKIKATESSQTS